MITEILQIAPDVRDMIMKGKSAEAVKTFAHSSGMTTLRECALRKALEGETSLEEVFRVTTHDQDDEAEESPEPATSGGKKAA